MPELNVNDLEGQYNISPSKSISHLEKLGLAITHNWRKAAEAVRDGAFTVAKVAKMRVLQDVRSEIAKSISSGETFEMFQKNILQKVEVSGWGGDKPYRLKNVFDTNIQSEYNVGRWNQFEENFDNRPYLQYIAILDGATRQNHRDMNGTIKKHDDPFWDTNYPPNGYRCRCRVRALNAAQATKKGITKSKNLPMPDEGFDFNPAKTKYEPSKNDFDKDIWDVASNV